MLVGKPLSRCPDVRGNTGASYGTPLWTHGVTKGCDMAEEHPVTLSLTEQSEFFEATSGKLTEGLLDFQTRLHGLKSKFVWMYTHNRDTQLVFARGSDGMWRLSLRKFISPADGFDTKTIEKASLAERAEMASILPFFLEEYANESKRRYELTQKALKGLETAHASLDKLLQGGA